ncbi:MAG TPA: histidine phosphatase family protein [Planctomycetota bacterium]|nr:histidine phosphatase family protein [Planctomycetota bacterium]
MLLVYLARHGETDWNAQGRIQGHTDVPLNEAGRDQALALAQSLARKDVAGVGASDLSRARDTARIVARTLGLEAPLSTSALRERGLGTFEGLTRAELERRHAKAWALYKQDPANTPPGGEPYDHFMERVQRGVSLLAKKLARRKRPALVVTHGGVLKALLLASLEAPTLVTVPNGAVFRFSVERGKVRRAPE